MSGQLPTCLPRDTPLRLTTALVVLDAGLRVVWMNDAMADLIEVGVRGVRDQPLAGLLRGGSQMLDAAIARLRNGETTVGWRHVRLDTLKQNAVSVDMVMQALEDGYWLLEIHALGPTTVAPTPLSDTLRGVAHEVKNPLTGLRGAAQLLTRRSTDEGTRQLADMMVEEVDRLAALTNRLLSHGGGAVLAMVNLYPVLERVRRLCLGQVAVIDEDYDPSLPEVYGDADRLQQLLLNLARNAIEAGATRLRLRTRVAHRVALVAEGMRTAVRVDVIDNGPGVSDAVGERLFQPMLSGRSGGTGLGLALALETARDHGGDLRHADTAEGTVFSLYLPVVEDAGEKP